MRPCCVHRTALPPAEAPFPQPARRFELRRVERLERERLQALQQAGYKTNRYAASAAGAGEDARCECVCARTRGAHRLCPRQCLHPPHCTAIHPNPPQSTSIRAVGRVHMPPLVAPSGNMLLLLPLLLPPRAPSR